MKQITYTALKTYLDCRRKYYWRYIMELVPLEKELKLWTGSLFHELLAEYYDLIMKGLPASPQALIEKALMRWRPEGEGRKAAAMATAMFRGYCARYPEEQGWAIQAVEYVWVLPVVLNGHLEPNMQLSGKVDLIVRIAGKLYLVEHKTTSEITGDYIERLPLDLQIHLYSSCLSWYLRWPIAGVIYNASKKTQIRQKKEESDEEFFERMNDAYREKPDEMFQRVELLLDPKNTTGLMYEVELLIGEILDNGVDQARYVRNPSTCFTWGSRCPYFALCTNDDNQNLIDNFYEKKAANIELLAANPE